jgi:hypothetical protein
VAAAVIVAASKQRGRSVTPSSGEVDLILAVIDQAFDRRSWHGTNLRGSIRGMTAGEAAWRPAPGRHNIWEIVVHAAYWKYAVRRRVVGERRGSFALKGSNWFERPLAAADPDALWDEDLALLAETHRALRRAVAELPLARLDAVALGGRTTVRDLLTGIAAHDLYHAGQIQLIKRLRSAARPARRPRSAPSVT